MEKNDENAVLIDVSLHVSCSCECQIIGMNRLSVNSEVAEFDYLVFASPFPLTISNENFHVHAMDGSIELFWLPATIPPLKMNYAFPLTLYDEYYFSSVVTYSKLYV